MPKLIVPPPYRGPTQGVGEIPVEGANLLACLEAADRKYPGLLAQVIDEGGGLHRFVKLFVNGDQHRGGLEDEVAEDDEIEILAAIAGG